MAQAPQPRVTHDTLQDCEEEVDKQRAVIDSQALVIRTQSQLIDFYKGLVEALEEWRNLHENP
jgi:hypothetical protein